MVMTRDPDEVKGDYYDTMQVCVDNGHKITALYDTRPEQRQNNCQICGSKTTSKCKKCGASIRGYHHMAHIIGGPEAKVPKHCHNCGAAYPWTKAVSNTQGNTQDITPIKESTQSINDRGWGRWIMGIMATVIAGLILAYVFGVGK